MSKAWPAPSHNVEHTWPCVSLSPKAATMCLSSSGCDPHQGGGTWNLRELPELPFLSARSCPSFDRRRPPFVRFRSHRSSRRLSGSRNTWRSMGTAADLVWRSGPVLLRGLHAWSVRLATPKSALLSKTGTCHAASQGTTRPVPSGSRSGVSTSKKPLWRFSRSSIPGAQYSYICSVRTWRLKLLAGSLA